MDEEQSKTIDVPDNNEDVMSLIFGEHLEDVLNGLSKVILYGFGIMGKDLCRLLQLYNIIPAYFCDDNLSKIETIYFGVPVISFAELKYRYHNHIILVSTNKYSDEIYRELLNNDFPSDRIITSSTIPIIENGINFKKFIPKKDSKKNRNILIMHYPVHEGWVSVYRQIIITLLYCKEINYKFSFLYNDRNVLPKDMLDLADIYTLTDEDLHNLREYGEGFLGKLPDSLKPDIVIYIGCIPINIEIDLHLRQHFANSVVMVMEGSLITRVPYEPMLCIDPIGCTTFAYISKYWSQIEQKFILNSDQKGKIAWLKNSVKEYILETSPFHETFEKYKDFEKIILLPLSIYVPPEYYDYYSYVETVLHCMPKNIGVIVTVHPIFRESISNHQFECLKTEYPNLIHEEIVYEYTFSSQYLLPHVNGVITYFNSSLTYQALLFDIEVIHVDQIISSELPNIKKLFFEQNKSQKNDSLLFWLLSRYSIFYSMRRGGKNSVYDNVFLSRFFENTLEYTKRGDFLNLYQEIEPYEICFDKIVSYMHGTPIRNIPPSLDETYQNTMTQYAIVAKYTENLQKGVELNSHERLLGKNILIYGMGTPGKTIYRDLMKKSNVHCTLIGVLNSDSIDRYEFKGDECVIVTPTYDFDLIEMKLREKGVTDILNIDDLIY